MNFLKQQKMTKYLILAGAVLLAVIVFAVSYHSPTTRAYADEEYWAVKVGDQTIAVFSNEQDADRVVDGVLYHDAAEGGEIQSVTCTPALSVERQTYSADDPPELGVVDETVDYILTGTKEKYTYEIKAGDTVWEIAMDNGFDFEEVEAMNPGVDLTAMLPGDTLLLYEMKPLVHVTMLQVRSVEKEIPYKTVTKKSDDLYEDETKVKQEGVTGSKMVEEQVTMENGKVVETTTLRSKVLKNAKKEIVLEGTKERPAASVSGGGTYKDSTVFSGDGAGIASFALQFVGNPYVYGGSSLTNGADCSGFVMAVFSNFGISMKHDAGIMRTYGRGVSLSEAQPGDLICYYGHVGIYVGGGQVVHAVNENMGIAVTSVGYVGPVLTVRRIVE